MVGRFSRSKQRMDAQFPDGASLARKRQRWEKLLYTARLMWIQQAEERVHPSGFSLPKSRHVSRDADLLIFRCLAITNFQASAGRWSFIRNGPNSVAPPDVFHFRHRFLPPKKGFAAACFIHEATWCSSRSSTDVSSTPRVDLPIPIGVTGGSGLISVPRMNISFT